MRFTEIQNNEEKVIEYNRFMDVLQKEYPETIFGKIETVYDRFSLYQEWLQELAVTEYAVVEDKRSIDFPVYVTVGFNWTGLLEQLTHYRVIDPYRSIYGVCDNAEQAIDYCREKLADSLDKNQEYLLVLVPLIREFQEPDGGWRWHKWGRYIGVQEPEAEYLYDEEDIDLVYVFKLVKVKKKK